MTEIKLFKTKESLEKFLSEKEAREKESDIDTTNSGINLALDKGEILYLLGPNGAGKSTLIFELARQINSTSVIAGNREIVFPSSAVSISAEQARLFEEWGRGNLHSTDARTGKAHHNSGDRLSKSLFQLKALCDDVNKRYRQAHINGQHENLQEINDSEPITLINEALRRSSIAIELDWDEKSSLTVRKGEYTYGMHSMSDGERAALIIASEVILCEKNAIIFIDEPERHLHRSISSPLLQYLKSIRTDLRWIISTHDLSLPRDNPDAAALIIYKYLGDNRWDADFLPSSEDLPPALLNAVYGARQKVIFVEGNKDSRDAPLYQQIFKGITIAPVGNCREVCECVSGLNALESIHLISGRGLVDGDNREDIDNLKEKGVHPLQVYAIESVYYHTSVVQEMIKHSSEDVNLSDVMMVALNSLGATQHLAKMTAYRSYRESHLRNLLDINAFSNSTQTTQAIDGPKLIAEAQSHLEDLIAKEDWSSITKHYKIKASGAPKAIANKLGYTGCPQYERAVIKAIDKDADLFRAVRNLVPNPFD